MKRVWITAVLSTVLFIGGVSIAQDAPEETPEPDVVQVEDTAEQVDPPEALDPVDFEGLFDFGVDGIDLNELLELLAITAVILGPTLNFLVGVLKHVGEFINKQWKRDFISRHKGWKLRLALGSVLLVVIAIANIVGHVLPVIDAINWFTQAFIPFVFVAVGVFGGSELSYNLMKHKYVKMPIMGYQRPDEPVANG